MAFINQILKIELRFRLSRLVFAPKSVFFAKKVKIFPSCGRRPFRRCFEAGNPALT